MITSTVYAYVLHRRPFKENSFIVDFYTMELGRIRAVVNNARSHKNNKQVTEPFCRYVLQLHGRGDLKTAKIVDLVKHNQPPHGAPLYSAMYLNELLMRSENLMQADADIFAAYEWALTALSSSDDIARVLRRVELLLLQSHGLAIDFYHDRDGNVIGEDCFYSYRPHIGFTPIAETEVMQNNEGFSGRVILDLSRQLDTPDTAKLLAKVCRQALQVLVGNEPFKSRELFKSYGY